MTSTRLQAGSPAPAFSVENVEGRALSLSSYAGGRLWLILSRFAACPFCSLRLHKIGLEHERLGAANVKVLVIFPSPPERVKQYAQKYQPPFDVAADPSERVFRLYHVENSWAGELRSAVRLDKVATALAAARQNPLAMDGAIHQMPADFVIGADGVIQAVRYGSELDDGFSVGEVLSDVPG